MQKLLILFVFLFFSFACFATDLLIINKDTFYLLTYPLEALHLKQRPFGLSKQIVQTNNQYPGYQAVWQIVDGKLYLENIFPFSGDTNQKENIADLLIKNDIGYQSNGKRIFADWLTMSCYSMEPPSRNNNIVYLIGSFEDTSHEDKVLLRFKNGILEKNKLIDNQR